MASSAPEPTTESTPPTAAPSSPPKPLLALPPPPLQDPNAPIQLNVSTSEPVSLYEKLGPTIVASDGTLSRIGNWAEMDELERARVLRVLGARNKVRLEDRKAQLDAEDKLKQEQAQ